MPEPVQFQFFNDEALTKPTGPELVNEAVPPVSAGEKARQTIYGTFAFVGVQPFHRLRFQDIRVTGDATRVSEVPKGELKPGNKFELVIEWTGREMTPATLKPLAAQLEISIILIADARSFVHAREST